jgi:hypothetical protein
VRQERRDDCCRHLTPFQPEKILRRRPDHQPHKEQPANEGRGNQQLEQRIGGRLNQGDLPVGGGDEGAALENRFEEGGTLHWRLQW